MGQMHGLLRSLATRRCSGSRVVIVYALLFAGLLPTLLAVGSRHVLPGAPVLVAALAAISALDYLLNEAHWSRVTAILDMGIALALLAVALAGPLAGFAILVIPDVIRLTRRRGAFWNAGLLANVVSYAAMALAGEAVLTLDPARGMPGQALALLLAGAAIAAASYFFARLLFVAVGDRESLAALLGRELGRLLAPLLLVIGAGIICGLMVAAVGVVALIGFAVLVYVPQVAVWRLLRAPSVAGISIDDAAAAYRAALADDLGLDRADRRSIEQTDALICGRPVHGDVENRYRVIQDAMLVRTCTRTLPSQPAFVAPVRVQVVLIARVWAQLTARCTPALNHHEALRELRYRPLAHDAPDALAAAWKIVEREHGLSAHTAAVPILHRAPLPRRARQHALPRALARLG